MSVTKESRLYPKLGFSFPMIVGLLSVKGVNYVSSQAILHKKHT